MLVEKYEEQASVRYFLETGRDFSKLTPTEQRKLVEAEYERESKGVVPSILSS